MKDNFVFASTAAVVNAVALNLCTLITCAQTRQVILNLAQLASPFIALPLTKLFIRADDPPELVRAESALNDAIKICQSQLKMKDIQPSFREKTQAQMEEFLLKKQKLRIDFAEKSVYTSSLPPSP